LKVDELLIPLFEIQTFVVEKPKNIWVVLLYRLIVSSALFFKTVNFDKIIETNINASNVRFNPIQA
jgi:hypothetical protein